MRWAEVKESRWSRVVAISAAATASLCVLYLRHKLSRKCRLLTRLHAPPGELPILGHYKLLLVRMHTFLSRHVELSQCTCEGDVRWSYTAVHPRSSL